MIQPMTMTFYQALVDAQIAPAAAHAVSEALRHDVSILTAEHQKTLMTQADGKSLEVKIEAVRADIAYKFNDLLMKLVGLAIAVVAAFKLIPSLHA